MAVKHASPTLTTTPAALWTDAAGEGGGKGRIVYLQNRGATTCPIGSSALSGVPPTVYGHLLAANGSLTVEIGKGDVLFGASTSGSQQVNVMVVDK
jgi:hypothetical protein